MAVKLRAALVRPQTWVVPYMAIWFLVGFLPIQQTDLDLFFWPSAKVAVAGQPLMVYSAGGQNPYPNANGPVALLPLTIVGLVARALGWLDQMTQRRVVVLGLFSIFLILMAREAVAAIERIRGAPLQGLPRLLAFAILTLSPPIWQSVLGYGHIEQPIEIWLLLIAARWLQREWIVRAGVALALAALSRSSALLLALPLALAAWRTGRDRAVRLFFATIATGIVGLLPFYLADRQDVTHSLFTYRGSLVVGAGSVWSLTIGTSLEPIVQHWDIIAVAFAVVAVNLWFATREGGMNERRMFAAMALTATSFLLLAKTVWPYYFFEVFVFATVWVAGSWRVGDGIVRLALIPVAISTFGMIAELGSEPDLSQRLVATEGAAMFAMLVLTSAWILWAASRGFGRSAGIAGPTATFERHERETADQRAGPS